MFLMKTKKPRIKSRVKDIANSLYKQLTNSIMNDLTCILDILRDIGIKENKKDTFLNLVLGNYIQT